MYEVIYNLFPLHSYIFDKQNKIRVGYYKIILIIITIFLLIKNKWKLDYNNIQSQYHSINMILICLRYFIKVYTHSFKFNGEIAVK